MANSVRSEYVKQKQSEHVLNNGTKVTYRLYVHKDYSNAFFKLTSSTGWAFMSQKFKSMRSLTNTFQAMLDSDYLLIATRNSDILLDLIELAPHYSHVCAEHTEQLGITKMPWGIYRGVALNEVPATVLMEYRKDVDNGKIHSPDPVVMAYIDNNIESIRKEYHECRRT